MPLLRHVATTPAAPLASTIQQRSFLTQPCSHLYYRRSHSGGSNSALSRPSPPQRQQQQRATFHTTSHLRDDQIDNAQNHYETLKLEPSATPAEVKKSFYALSKRHHPDLHQNDADRPAASRRFMRISEAYAVLSVPAKRRAYDRDTLRLDHHHQQSHQPHGRRPAGSYHSSSVHSSNPAGGRPASGLSRRRGTFQGPPPSFFRSGGWGAHGAKRKAAHDDSAGNGGGTGGGGATRGPMGGTNPGQDPLRGFGHGDDDVPPHFDRAGHARTGRHVDARRAARQEREGQAYASDAGSGSSDGGRAAARPEERGLFFVIGGVVLLSFLGPFVIGRLFGWDKGDDGRRRRTKTVTKAAAAAKKEVADGS
ncbi:hypothetical protein SLS62_001910 [Diatrype stigma]|uniref:J domain-containing protein n=1 Tax=Diatrype stigma TaxID=117547 RepID=A0AAN9UX91_9PEZI